MSRSDAEIDNGTADDHYWHPVDSAGDDLLAVLDNVRIQFWTCPVVEHRRRTAASGGPVVTVEWRDGIAHCTAPDCVQTSQQLAERTEIDGR